MFIFTRGRKSRLNGQHPGFTISDLPGNHLGKLYDMNKPDGWVASAS
jgi:hypothetical protein